MAAPWGGGGNSNGGCVVFDVLSTGAESDEAVGSGRWPAERRSPIHGAKLT
jgi:hypothetical protein